LPSDHFLNVYVKHQHNVDLAVTGFGQRDRVRTTGTFSYLGGYTVFLIAMFNLSLAYILTRGRNLNIVALVLLTATCMAMFTTGSRGVFLSTIGILPIVLYLCLRENLISSTLFTRLTMASVLIAAAALFFVDEAIDAFRHRLGTSDSAVGRMFSPVTQTAEAFEVTPLLGLGIGVTHNSASTITGISSYQRPWWLHGNIFEDETARVMQEVGVFGFVLVYAVRFALLAWAIAMVRRLRSPRFKVLSACIVGFFIVHIPAQVINNPTANLYLWFAAGLLFAMYQIDYARYPRYSPHKLSLLPSVRHRAANAMLYRSGTTPGK
jgi:hypothetical protein